MFFFVVVVQFNGNFNEEVCIDEVMVLIWQVVEYGVCFIVMLEVMNYFGLYDCKVVIVEGFDGCVCRYFGQFVVEFDVYLLFGFFNEIFGEMMCCYNISVFFGLMGEIFVFYCKMYFFDVDVFDEVCFKELDICWFGEDVVVIEIEFGKIGFSICYDMCFFEFYWSQVDVGVKIFVVFFVFIVIIGCDYWYLLFKVCVIENQCWFIVLVQWGEYDDGGLCNSYGYLLIIDLWGQVVVLCFDGMGIVFGVIDFDCVDQIC